MEKYLKRNKGVTLVALIIMIIVLVILSGVVISLAIGNENIIENANEAIKEYSKVRNDEGNVVTEYENYLDAYKVDNNRED